MPLESHQKPVAARSVEDLADATVAAIKAYLDRHVARLETRIAELEGRPTLSYRGVHETGTRYRMGDAVTRSGSLWVAEQDSPPGVPGTGHSGWKLAVKSSQGSER